MTPPTAERAADDGHRDAEPAAGSSRRSTLIDSGNSPYEAPCRIRPTSSSGNDVATMASTVPRDRDAGCRGSPAARRAGRPSRPSTGVRTAAASRLAVSTQPAPRGDVELLGDRAEDRDHEALQQRQRGDARGRARGPAGRRADGVASGTVRRPSVDQITRQKVLKGWGLGSADGSEPDHTRSGEHHESTIETSVRWG